MKIIVFLAMTLSLMGCAAVCESDRFVAPRGNGSGMSSIERFAIHNEQCMTSWQALYDDWFDNGFRIPADLNDAQNYLAGDDTVLSRIFRDAWRLQKRRADDVDRVAAYDDAAMRSGAMPSECASFMWLQGFIASDEAIYRGDAKQVLEEQMGVHPDDPRRLAVMVMNVLLTPPRVAQTR